MKKQSKVKTKAPSTEWSTIKSVKRERLINERKKKGLTQGELAKLLGISTSMVSHIENGRVVPNVDVCLTMQEIFNTPYEELIPDF